VNISPTLVIGDLHGRWQVVEKALESGYDCIFMGDYLDSFTASVEDQARTLRMVLEAIKSDPDKYVGLLGNHELSYLDDTMRASGYKRAMSYHVIHEFQRDMHKHLKTHHFHNKWLLSHAGVSQAILDEDSISLEEYLELKSFTAIGHRRGGMSPIGGLYWCDWYAEFEPTTQAQIVGHTGYREKGDSEGIVTKGNAFNVDCLDRVDEFLLLTGDEYEIIQM